jgi:hypothetical protein
LFLERQFYFYWSYFIPGHDCPARLFFVNQDDIEISSAQRYSNWLPCQLKMKVVCVNDWNSNWRPLDFDAFRGIWKDNTQVPDLNNTSKLKDEPSTEEANATLGFCKDFYVH